MSHKKVGKEESERRARANLKDFHCLYPEDLVPFSRKPLVVIVDSSKSNAFEFSKSVRPTSDLFDVINHGSNDNAGAKSEGKLIHIIPCQPAVSFLSCLQYC